MRLFSKVATTRLLLTCLSFSVAAVSCKKDTQDHQQAPIVVARTENIDSLRTFLHESMGIALEKIVFDSARQLFVINHTGLVMLETAKLQYTASISGTGNSAGGRYVNSLGFFMSLDSAPTVRVYIPQDSNIIPGSWSLAATMAIFAWNETDSKIHIEIETNPAAANIHLTSFYTVVAPTSPSYLKEVAQGVFPVRSGGIGRTVSVNLAYTGIISQDAKLKAVVHALSHCFGFTNNEDGGAQIIGEMPVPVELNSAFNTLSRDWAGFTFFDYVAIGKIFPRPYYNEYVRLLRYFNPDHLDHSTVTDITVYGAGANGYVFEKGYGYVRKTAADTTHHPIYRYEHPLALDNFLTTDFSENAQVLKLGYVYKGIIGYVTFRQLPGQKPLYRYWSNGALDHLYTNDFNDLGISKFGYDFEKTIGYVW